MTNHFDQATSRIAEAVQLRQTLDDTYDLRPHDRLSIATLHESLRFCLSMAKLHSNLAEVQALYDLRSEVTELVKDLTGNVVAVYEPVEQPVAHLRPVPES